MRQPALFRRGAVRYDAKISDNFHEELEPFENQFPDRDYLIETVCPEIIGESRQHLPKRGLTG